jgi:hypothetical protein
MNTIARTLLSGWYDQISVARGPNIERMPRTQMNGAVGLVVDK